MTGGYSNLNFMVFIILAIGGAFLAFSVRRILFKIRETERRIAATVDEKNEAAADLRVARQQEEQLLQALEEGEEALREIARRTDEVQNRMAVLRQATPRPLNLVSLEWAQGDHLYEAHLRNVVAPRHVGRAVGGMAEAGVVHGYAPTEADFRALVTNRLASEGGYIISSVLPISLGDEGPAVDGAAPVEPPAEDEPLGDLMGSHVADEGAAVEPPVPAGPKPLPVRPPAATRGVPRGMGMTPAAAGG
ncbi:hypothetical protein [Nitrospirillum amazonense]|uniref:Uncharacterized protein n=1 Tax=Nitrospirillum amazonense TaxID=28077 RepID=A0A560J9W6_9PROT|nr:hypothetical protein [Nitrospirillum amazonense]MDG3440968.1 hypothetical protein [Nitrospirillum amazonense]TWB67981.1 hypothetical protein FBZ87_11222 [Nitrospirillum amazonense]